MRRCEWIGLILVLLILFLDQWLKFWVKTNMSLGEEIALLGNWAKLYFVENFGIAFGLKPGNEIVKLVLSLGRILSVGAFCYLAHWVARSPQVPKGIYYATVGVIAGALGNVIDGTFYGQLFSSSEGYTLVGEELVPAVATFLPEGGGYAPLFQGKVVDMFYFPIIDLVLPEGMPFWGGMRFVFFSPIFNIADVVISVSLFYLLIFHWRYFWKLTLKPKNNTVR